MSAQGECAGSAGPDTLRGSIAEREAAHHDRWAEEIDLEELCVYAAFEGRVSPEYLPLWWRRAAVVALCVGLTASAVDLERHFVASRMLTTGFWGWQSGPREAINHFLAHCGEYDDLVLSAQFNAPEIFPRFYDPEGRCPKMSIGNLSLRRLGRRQLFALRPYEITAPDSLLYRGEILNPDGAVELLLVEGN